MKEESRVWDENTRPTLKGAEATANKVSAGRLPAGPARRETRTKKDPIEANSLSKFLQPNLLSGE
jgi:hypothetical protein